LFALKARKEGSAGSETSGSSRINISALKTRKDSSHRTFSTENLFANCSRGFTSRATFFVPLRGIEKLLRQPLRMLVIFRPYCVPTFCKKI
jgi:hypothetical protein